LESRKSTKVVRNVYNTENEEFRRVYTFRCYQICKRPLDIGMKLIDTLSYVVVVFDAI
jgi:predicted metal-binding protein